MISKKGEEDENIGASWILFVRSDLIDSLTHHQAGAGGLGFSGMNGPSRRLEASYPENFDASASVAQAAAHTKS